MTDYNIPLKRCTKCGEEKPATLEYFWKHNLGKHGLDPQCKRCRHDKRQANREQLAQKDREKYQRNREHIMQRRRQHYAKNRERIAKETQKYRASHVEQIARQKQSWYEQNPHTWKAASQRRRARKRALPGAWTAQHWLACLDYFHNTCAVCGGQLRDLFGNIEPHQEHWIPLDYKGADNPGTVPGNMLPLCSPCNLSKGSKLPQVWLVERYGKAKAVRILLQIDVYFSSIRHLE